MNVLVTGSNGQLGSELHEITKIFSIHHFVFVDKKALDITSNLEVENYFKNNNFDYCINCAAYTAVDKCEENIKLANLVNTNGPENLAIACKKYNTILIHISTDFVFSGEKNIPYNESDKTGPINIYGTTKLKGEKAIQSILQNFFIIRTSWLYSSFGSNFVRTMLRIAKTKNSIGVVNDQIGTPTYARDLAKVLIKLIENKNSNFGLYHYSNEGVASWYDFARAIFDISKFDNELNPISTDQYPLPAERPKFSIMNKDKIKKNLNVSIPYWTHSLKECLNVTR